MDIKIDKGFPLPVSRRKAIAEALGKMTRGDSILLTASEAKMARCVCPIVTQKDADGLVRVWRVDGEEEAIKIERGIAPPPPIKAKAAYGSLSRILRKLEVGDSLLWPGNISAIANAKRRLRIDLRQQKQPDGTVRVWRVG